MSDGFAMVIPVEVTAANITTSVAISEAAWNSGTTYADGDIARRLFADGLQHRVESLVGSNLNNDPALDDDASHWLDLGPVNAHAMLDDTTTTVTADADEIEVEIAVASGRRADTVWLAALAGESVRLQIEDPVAGPVHDETYSLADVGAITDLWAYFTTEVLRKTEMLLTDLPNGAGSTVTVTVNHPGDTAECGHLVLGQRMLLGVTRWGAQPEIRDYSRWVEDAFGGREFVPGAYRKLLTCELVIETRRMDGVLREMTRARAEPRLFIADPDFTALAVFGTAKWRADMSQAMAPDYLTGALQIEGNT